MVLPAVARRADIDPAAADVLAKAACAEVAFPRIITWTVLLAMSASLRAALHFARVVVLVLHERVELTERQAVYFAGGEAEEVTERR